ncbi:MAG: class I SAM-dependent methyltransferase [Proteobacteria bacterium]|nr:class I SAM-dependent methyltransferase [Pseudomonadota bacterium]MBU1610223.1 class I SAM-dependent methyltransferase [Pseudomonadota bacterium]
MKHGDFSSLADDYAKYRPGYSPMVLSALFGMASDPKKDLSVADVGAGTGIWSRMMLGQGRQVTSVEPNNSMREQGIRLTRESGDALRWVAGSAEQTTLKDESCDVVTMASSFHWPDFDAAITEFHRILRPGGLFMALWNTRFIHSNPILVEIEEKLHSLVPNMKRVSSGKSEFCDSLFESLHERSEFSDVLYLEGRHSEQQSVERYIGLWRSVNDVRVQAGETRFEAFLSFIAERLEGVEYINADYTTRAWIAKKA